MREDVALLLVASAALVAAVVLVVAPDPAPQPDRTGPGIDRRRLRAAGLGALAALVVVASSGWAVPAAVVGVATTLAVRARQRRRPHRTTARTDALASWIENLRDVLLAGDQPIGAITTTVDTCPEAIRPEVRRLALALGRLDPEDALREFADDLDDPLGDLVAAGLLIAVRRGARTVDVLSSLAAQARAQADRRRIVDAERAPLQREVTLLTSIMGALVGALLVFGRAEYLRAYDTVEGQLVLGTALALYAALLLRVQRLAVLPAPRRFLIGRRHEHPSAADGRRSPTPAAARR